MANKKISNLSLATPSQSDIIPFLKLGDTTQSLNGSTRGMTVNSLLSLVNAAVANAYTDVSALLADQGNQNEGYIYYVEDASDDAEISSGSAYYRYLGTLLGTLADYDLLTSEQANAIENYTPPIHSFTVSYKSTTEPNETVDETIAVHYEDVYDSIESLLFPETYSHYLSDMAALKTAYGTNVDFAVALFNKTQSTWLGDIGCSFEPITTDYIDYVRVSTAGALDANDVEVGDIVDVYFYIYGAPASGANELIYPIEADETIVTTKTLDHDYMYFGIKTMTGNTTFSDTNLVVDGITRGMYLTGNFTPTFPAYWEPDPNSETYDGTVYCRVTWDVLKIGTGTELVKYNITVLTS